MDLVFNIITFLDDFYLTCHRWIVEPWMVVSNWGFTGRSRLLPKQPVLTMFGNEIPLDSRIAILTKPKF